MADALAGKHTRAQPGAPTGGPSPRRAVSFAAGAVRIKELSILLVTVAAAIYFSFTNAGFNSAENYHTIAQYVAPWAIVAAGEVMLLICGEIDLSAGFVFTLSPFLLMVFFNNGAPLFVALLGALVVSAVIGTVNGLIRTVFNVPAFITTLGMAFLLQGLSLVISGGSPVSAPSTGWVVTWFGRGPWTEFVWALLIVAAMQILLSTTRFGIYTQ